MGYKKRRRLYPLDFGGTLLEGLNMTMRGLTIQESLDLSTLQELAQAPEDVQRAKLAELFEFVAERIEEWDLEDDDGNRIEPSAQELMSWDAGDAFGLITAWQNAVQAVAAPLDQPSNDGIKLGAVSIPMEIPSPNLPS